MQEINLKSMLVSDLTDTVGAAKILSDRFERSVSVDAIHTFVRKGWLQSYMFQNGELTPRPPKQPTRGKDLLFLKAHLMGMEPPPRPGNPNFQRGGEKENLPKSRKK
jgi:hypothetical protein